MVTEQEHFGFEVDHALHARDEREREAEPVAAHRHEVREVAEQGREHVADERDAFVREPDDERVDGLAAGHRQQLEAPAAELECVRVLEQHVGHDDLRPRRDLGVVAAHEAGLAHDRREEGERATDAEAVDALVVGLARGVVGLRDELRAVATEPVDAADVIGVALREDDVAGRRVAHRVEVPLVRLGLEPHAGVDDDPALVGDDEIRVRHPG